MRKTNLPEFNATYDLRLVDKGTLEFDSTRLIAHSQLDSITLCVRLLDSANINSDLIVSLFCLARLVCDHLLVISE